MSDPGHRSRRSAWATDGADAIDTSNRGASSVCPARSMADSVSAFGGPATMLGRIDGVSLMELVVVLALMAVLASFAAASLAALRADARALGAAHYLAARLSEERIAAIRHGRTGGLYFQRAGDTHTFQRVVDENGNGLRAADVASGIDRLLDAPMAIDHLFPGVTFALVRAVPPVDGEGPALVEGSDPIRIGPTSFLSFGPAGTGSSGTLYLATPERRQLAVRVFGTTGRVRVFELVPASGTWERR
jgi:prepilin-type N-terminal cleavage/methylation domain-containing protein